MIKLVVANDKTSKNFIKETIKEFHSYVQSVSSVGRRIDWVVFNDDKPIGMIGIGSSVYPPPKDILTHIKMTKNEYKNNFNSFANNWRFCMREKIKNRERSRGRFSKRLRKCNVSEPRRGHGAGGGAASQLRAAAAPDAHREPRAGVPLPGATLRPPVLPQQGSAHR